MPRCRVGSFRDLEPHHFSVEWRTHAGIAQIALRESYRRFGAAQLREQALRVGDALTRLIRLLQGRRQRHLGAALVGACLVDLLPGHEALVEQRLETPARILRELELRA